MNSKTIYTSNSSTFSFEMTMGLALKDKNGKIIARLIDERFLVSLVSGEIVGKEKIKIQGFTQDGIKKLMEAIK